MHCSGILYSPSGNTLASYMGNYLCQFKCKTKTILKNGILLKLKCDFKKKVWNWKSHFVLNKMLFFGTVFALYFFQFAGKSGISLNPFLMELTWLSKEFLSSLMLEWLNWRPTLLKGIALFFCAFVVFLSVAISTSLICLNLICWLIVPKKYVNRFLGCFYLEKFCHSYPLSLINFKYFFKKYTNAMQILEWRLA